MKKISRNFFLLILILVLIVPMTVLANNSASTKQQEARNSVVRIYVKGVADIYALVDDSTSESYDRSSGSSGNSGSSGGNYVAGKATPDKDAVSLQFLASADYTAVGSGVCLGKKGQDITYVLTNRHVVCSASDTLDINGVTCYVEYKAETIYVLTDTSASKIEAKCVYDTEDSDLDYVILSLDVPINNKIRQPITIKKFEDSGDVLGGLTVAALGFPGDYDKYYLNEEASKEYKSSIADMSITVGNINRVIPSDASTKNLTTIVHSATINGGNSGGALVDENGCLIGINTWTYAAMDNTYAAISINNILPILDKLFIPYEIESNNLVLIILIAVAVLMIGVTLFLVFKQKKSRQETNKRILSCDAGSLAGKKWELLPNKPLLVGRAQQANVRYPDEEPGISGNHCTIVFTGSEVRVTDSSRKGTFIDGCLIGSGHIAVLHRGHKMTLGSEREVNVFTIHSPV